MSLAGVVRTYHHAVPRDLNAREYRACHVPGVHIPRVRSDAAQSRNRCSGGVGEVGLRFLTKLVGVSGIEASSYGRISQSQSCHGPSLSCGRCGTNT